MNSYEIDSESWGKMSVLERELDPQLYDLSLSYNIPYEKEFRFHPVRRWKFDFAIPHLMIAIECEGGTFSKGRHTRGLGFRNDCVKYNTAAIMGWTVLRFDAHMISEGDATRMIEEAIIKRIEAW